MAENIIFKKIGFYIVKNWSSNVKSMSQKSILSFFQKQSIATSTSTLKEKSPTIKKKFNIGSEKKVELLEVKKKRKRINLASDSEEEIINSSPERKKRSIEPTLNTPNNKNDESMNELSKTEIEENGLNGDKNELPEQENRVNGNIETKENTEKPTLKTLSFLGSKKKQSKTPKKITEKKNKKSEDNKTPGKKTPAKVKTSPSTKSEDETPIKKTPTKAKTSPSTKKSPQKKKNVEKNNKKEISENLENKDKDDDKSKSNNEKAFLINKSLNNAESNTDYFPDKKNYHPINDASWKHGERVPYIALAKTLQKIEETSSRLKIIEILSNYLRSVLVLSPNDFLPSVYLCLNKLAPAYEGLELGIADMYLMKAVAQCTGRTNAQIKADVANTGDLGIVAEQSRSNQRIMFRPAPLTVQSVFNQLKTIAKFSGNAAMTKKVDIIEALFVACRECEARFVIRSLAGKMRIGLAEQSVLQAIALACTATPTNQEFPPKILNAADGISANEFKKKYDEQALILKTTFCECPDYNKIIPVLLEEGIEALPEKCKITPGLPVKPMLAQPTKGAREVLERFEGMKFTCEWKYDGERAQIHLMEDGKIKIYSRNQEDNTSKYPDIIKNLRELITSEIKSFILDAEVVAWDSEQKKIKPFQILSTRKRKDAQENEIKVQVCVFMFDLLYFNGESLIQKPLIERRELLHSNFKMIEGKFMYVTSLDTNTMEEVQECLEESVKGNCEGLMVKTLDTEATYEIAKRSRNWLKLKKDYLEGVGDTLDLVVIGGYTGKGKRTGQYGGFLLASYDVDNEEYQAICKIGTGFTDEMLAQHAEFFKSHIILSAKSYYRYHSSLEPDHWFDAVQVWEVKCADLSLSPIYLAAIGLVDPEKGISLRFPRFLKIRDDKSVEQATSSQQVAEMYKNQDQIKNQGNTDANFNEEDF